LPRFGMVITRGYHQQPVAFAAQCRECVVINVRVISDMQLFAFAIYVIRRVARPQFPAFRGRMELGQSKDEQGRRIVEGGSKKSARRVEEGCKKSRTTVHQRRTGSPA